MIGALAYGGWWYLEQPTKAEKEVVRPYLEAWYEVSAVRNLRRALYAWACIAAADQKSDGNLEEFVAGWRALKHNEMARIVRTFDEFRGEGYPAPPGGKLGFFGAIPEGSIVTNIEDWHQYDDELAATMNTLRDCLRPATYSALVDAMEKHHIRRHVIRARVSR